MEVATEYRRLFDRITFTGLIILAALIFSLICWGIFYSNHYPGLVTVDAMDQAQVARHLYLGQGFTTGFIKPISILSPDFAINGPDLYNSPLPVFFLSRFFNIIGLNDSAVLGHSVFWAVLTGILLIIFSRLLFHNLILALLTFVVYMLSPGVIESTFSGLPLSFVEFILLTLAFIYYFRNRSSLLWTASLGIIAGILFLSEFDFFFLSLLIGVLVVSDSNGKRSFHVLAFFLPYILIILPWLIRNSLVAGEPLTSLRWHDFKAYTLIFSGNQIVRDFNPDLFATPFPLLICWNKFLMFVRLMYKLWLSLSHSLLVPFFLGGVLIKYKDQRWARVIKLAVVLFFSQLILISLGNGDFSRILYFMPLIIIGGVAAFLQLLNNLGFSIKTVGGDFIPDSVSANAKVSVGGASSPDSSTSSLSSMRYALCSIWIFFILLIFPGLISIIYGLPNQRYIAAASSPEEARLMTEGKTMEKVERMVKEHEVVVSDMPWAIAWYAHRNAIWIPWEIEQMKDIKEKVKDVRFLHLSPMIFKYPDTENVDGWQKIYQSGMVPEWLHADRGILIP
ncbi:MAG: hypothetical protein U9N73_10630, partial [Candidatus Auribacterota bacterium]|nr:hypothetical protein [Candidatus Auribacterota bacterium]